MSSFLRKEVVIMKRSIKRFSLVILALFVFGMANLPVNAITIATDPPNDVGKVVYGKNGIASYTSANRPEIDIVSGEYIKESSGNVTIKVTFSATPVIDAHHWYSIGLGVSEDAAGFSGAVLVGTLAGDFNESDAVSVVATDDTVEGDFGWFFASRYSASEVISGNSLVFTFQTNSDLGNHIYTYPDDPSSKGWEFSVTAWYSPNLQSAASQIENTEIYLDYYPDSDNYFDPNNDNLGTGLSDGSNTNGESASDNGSNNLNLPTSPGFEIATVFLGLLAVIPIVLLKKRRV